MLDITYGKGVFWRNVVRTNYQVVTNDLYTKADVQADFGALPFKDSFFDAIVFDPPYLYGGGTKTLVSHLDENYGVRTQKRSTSYADGLNLYNRGIAESRRLLKPGGILIIKGMDSFQNGKFTSFIRDFFSPDGFRLEDVFVLVRSSPPLMRFKYQYHARKNHSYFLVYYKCV